MNADAKTRKVIPPLARPFWPARFFRRATEDDLVKSSADALQRRYLRPVLTYVAGRISENAADAEDLAAEVFAAAFASLHHCPVVTATSPDAASTSEHDPVRAWLFGIARRKVADYYRLRARRPQTQTVVSEAHTAPAHQEPEPVLLEGEAHQTLYALLSGLPEIQREAVHLRYIDGLSVEDTAHVLNKTPNATAQLLHRARQTLRTRGAAYFTQNNDTETR